MRETSILQDLAQRLAAPVDETTRARAALHVVDWMGCAVTGAREPAGRVLLEAAKQGTVAQAFAWGGLGNILEMDDVDKRAVLHPGPSIIPAALTLADGQNGVALFDAIVRGYEATIRLGRAVGAEHYAMWHSTGTCGAIGAAAACASLLKLDALQTSHAMALAMSLSAGLWQTRHEATSMGKQLHTAHASRTGVEAARLASHGFKGPLSIVEGEQGFFAAMCPGADPADMLKDYGNGWLIHDVSFKPWPACRHAHAAIDAALLAQAQHKCEAIERVTVRTYSDALKFCDRPNPETVIEAKFSLQHAVATVLLHGKPLMQHFEPEAIRAADVSALRAKVTVETASDYEMRYPARFGSGVEVVTSNGRRFYDVPDALGDPENPLTQDQIEAKAIMLFRHAGIEPKPALGLVSGLQSDAPVQPLIQSLQEAFHG